MSAANVLWIRSRPAVAGQYLPPEGIDLVLGTPPPPASLDELSFEYLATAWLIGREGAETLRLEPLFGNAPVGSDGAEAAALRHGMASAAGTLRPGGWFNLMLDGDDPDRLLAVATAGAAAGLELESVIPRESRRSGDGLAVHFRKPSSEDRLRSAVGSRPLQLGAESGHLTYPELAAAVDRAAVALLRDRGEPAGLTRVACAVVMELGSSGLLRRLGQVRGGESRGIESEPRQDEELGGEEGGERRVGANAASGMMLAALLREELWRDDHPNLIWPSNPWRIASNGPPSRSCRPRAASTSRASWTASIATFQVCRRRMRSSFGPAWPRTRDQARTASSERKSSFRRASTITRACSD